MQKEYKTKNKDLIVDYIKQNKDKRFSANDVFAGLEREGHSINITTVYRNLEKLTDNGQLLKFKNPGDDSSTFQYAQEDKRCSSHLHVQCTSCGRVLHLNHTFMEEFTRYLDKESGFSINCCESVLVGHCRDCR